jgi:hypothetical protein
VTAVNHEGDEGCQDGEPEEGQDFECLHWCSPRKSILVRDTKRAR